MKNEVTQAQVQFYQDNGFLVIENFLDAAELETWRHNTDEAVAQRLATADRALTNQGGADDYYTRVFTQCIKLLETHAGMKEIMLAPRLGKLAATLAGVDGIRIWHDQALIKPPFGNPTAWHLDNPFWSFSSPDAISLWVALDDATLSNGCLYYLPGTQKMATYQNTNIGMNLADLFKIYPEWQDIAPVACPCPAGSAVLHNGLVGHGAGANMTKGQRRAITCAYMPDGATFNGVANVLPPDYIKTLAIGDVLNNNAVNPLVWSAG